MRAARVGLALLVCGGGAANFTETCLALRRQACDSQLGASWDRSALECRADAAARGRGRWHAGVGLERLPLYKYRSLSPNVSAELERLGPRQLVLIGDSTVRNQFMHLALHLLPNCSSLTLASCVLLKRQQQRGFWSSTPQLRARVHDQEHGFWGSILAMRASSAGGASAVYYRSHACSTRHALGQLRRLHYLSDKPPDAILYNVGAHNLHVFPAPRVSPAASELKCLLDFGAFFRRSLGELRDSSAGARIVWRTSTAFCEGRWGGVRRDLIRHYQCLSGNATEQEAVYQACERRLGMSALECVRSLLGREAVMLHRQAALRLLAEQFPDVGLLDGYALTEGTCHLADPFDAIHRVKLLNHINLSFLRELQRLFSMGSP
ncbi:hypothetical protein AB1Y20_020904 [Prymnesium parvum]|uniref:Uncharacterized protein n=1 Tax=Prymnesium parvum TaxID=97485 RepID=A0AB34JIW1_PRYPA